MINYIEKWWDKLKQYEKEYLSKEYKNLKYKTFEEWLSKVYEANKQKEKGEAKKHKK